MDIHRCRFVPYMPHSINAAAFSHPSSLDIKDKGPSTLRLALGRANGDIEIWNPQKGNWVQETIFRGGKDRSIEGLAWIQDPEEEDEDGALQPGKLRLLSHGYTTAVTEWDLEKGRPARHAHGNHGEIWCLASQPRWHKTNSSQDSEFRGQHLAAGCADGVVVIFSTADGDLNFKRTLVRPSVKRARVLSITFQNRNTVVAGYADSTIRVFDIRTGQILRNMSLGSGPKGQRLDTLVWSVRALPDGTIVSGDSSGEIRFWDAANYSLFQRIQSHKADILDIVVSVDGRTVMSGGADARTILYRFQGEGKRKRWAELLHRRFHSHDVKAMAVFETKQLSVVASGGLDTTPIITPFRQFSHENHRSLTNLPQSPQASSSPLARLVISWWDREVRIWRVLKNSHGFDGTGDSQNSHKEVSRVLIQGEESITSANISNDGSLLTVSTGSEVRLFSLTSDRAAVGLKVRKIEIQKQIASAGARLVQISPDSRWLLVVQPDNIIRLLRIIHPSPSNRRHHMLARTLRLNRLLRNTVLKNFTDGSLGSYNRTIRCAIFSHDSRIVAVSDLAGYIDTWVLQGHEDLEQAVTRNRASRSRSSSADSSSEQDSSEDEGLDIIFGQRWLRNPAGSMIPKLDAFPLFLSFRPVLNSSSQTQANGTPVTVHPTRRNLNPVSQDSPISEDRLLAVTSENHLIEFNVLRGELSSWSRRNPKHLLPAKYADIRDRALGCIWDVRGHQERVWVYGPSFLCMFDLSRDLQPLVEYINHDNEPKRKRKSDHGVSSRKHESGAGHKKKKHDTTGFGSTVQKQSGPIVESGRHIDLAGKSTQDSDGETNDLALAKLRRNENVEGDERGDASGPTQSDGCSVRKVKSEFWWTMRYRYIFGMLPLNKESAMSAVEGELPEACLIERPKWDLDLPPRYDGDHDWDR